MTSIEIKDLEKTYLTEAKQPVGLSSLSVTLPLKSFTVITGKSGSGKTTLLRLLAGLTEPTKGSIHYVEEEHSLRPFAPIKAGMVFQEPRLLPWLTVERNFAFASLGGISISKELIHHYLDLLGLEAFKNAYPHQLSGGMAQRVALGRALCAGSDILLLDEPFGALDYFTRQKLQEDMYELFKKENKTVFFVTHDLREAALLSDQVLCLKQQGPHQLFKSPIPYVERKGSPLLHQWESELASYL